MNVLMIEDDYRSGYYAEVIQNEGHNVQLVDNLYEAMEELAKRGSSYDAVILDLALNGSDLPTTDMKKMVIDDGLLPGCVFHMKVMENKYPALAARTIFFTGLPQQAKDTAPEWYEKYADCFTPKTETGYKKRILEILTKWEALKP